MIFKRRFFAWLQGVGLEPIPIWVASPNGQISALSGDEEQRARELLATLKQAKRRISIDSGFVVAQTGPRSKGFLISVQTEILDSHGGRRRLFLFSDADELPSGLSEIVRVIGDNLADEERKKILKSLAEIEKLLGRYRRSLFRDRLWLYGFVIAFIFLCALVCSFWS